MPMQPSDHIIAPSRGDADDVINYADDGNAYRPADCEHYIRAVYALCEPDDLPDAALVISQSVHETSDPGPWQSHWWDERLNPAGMGITGDPVENEQSHWFTTGEEAARAQVAHLLLYATGTIDRGGLTPADDPRYDAYVDAYGAKAMATTLSDLAGTWAVDEDYDTKICQKAEAIYDDLPDQGEEPPVEPSTPPASALHILVNAGHHSTDRTGNDAEEALTFDLSLAWVNELLSRGFAAESLQRDADSDTDPNDVVGDLDDIGQEEAAWMARTPGDLVLISCHYNGSHSPLHAIVPDNVNLSTAVPNGDPPDDTAANNTLDCDLGSAIITTMNRAGLGGIYTGRLGRPGLMSERETGVGLDGWRLAEMAYTAPHRKRAVRLVVEHGGTSDPAARRFADFARAGVDAIVAVYGIPDEPVDPVEPEEPERIFPSSRIPVEVVSQGFVLTPTCPDRFRCLVETPMRTYPDLEAPAGTSTPATEGEVYTFDFVVDVDDADWLVSKAGSWVPADAFEPED